VRRRMKLLVLLLAGTTLALLLIIHLVSARFEEEGEFYSAHAAQLQRDLGFVHGSPYVRLGSFSQEVATIAVVTPGGPFARAGLQSGDILVTPKSSIELYRLLEAARGGIAKIAVVRGGDGPPMDERPINVVEVSVPFPLLR